MHQSIPPAPSSYILMGNRVRVKSSEMARGLANARPPGSVKFANAPPPGLKRRATAPGEGDWTQVELTDALKVNKYARKGSTSIVVKKFIAHFRTRKCFSF